MAETVCKRPNEIQNELTLLGDLGMDGDDAAEFLEEFAKRFEVNMECFKFEKHFGPEGMYPWQFPVFVWRLISGIWDRREPEDIDGLKVIKVEDLIQAAKTKRWK